MRSAPSTRRPVANGPWVRFTGKKVTEGTGGWVGGLGVLYMERLVLYMEFCCYIWKLLFTSGGGGWVVWSATPLVTKLSVKRTPESESESRA